MNQLIVNKDVETFFRQLTDRTELRDPAGNVLGIYTPMAELATGFDLEEAEKTLERERDQGKPFAEVLQRLQSLEQSR